MEIILSTSNKDKIYEIQNILGDQYTLLSKKVLAIEDFDVEETGSSLKEKAYIKAKSLYDTFKKPVLADDTGLFVDALNGKPGIYSARYAGENANYEDNNDKLLKDLSDIKDLEKRTARFITVLCFIDENGKDHYLEGELEGYIAFNRLGHENKFGYNPIFIIKSLDKTLAQASDQERLSVNHRRRALDKLKVLLEEIKWK